MNGDEYRAVLRRLTALDATAAAHRAEAVAWHEGRVAAADDAVRAADDAVREAAGAVRAAQRDLEEVDARAAGLWSDFVHRVGPAAERFGRTVPQPAVPRQRGELTTDDYLREVAAKIAYTPPARPLTGATTTVFAMFGVVGGLLGVAAHQLLRWAGTAAGGDWAAGLPVVALIALVLSPVVAVFAAKRVADRRGAELNAAAITTVLVSGLVTAGLLVAALGGG
ncbi:hypothetical protein EV385_0293 [Krasilnikovia cinnamomea]|uniref:Uncharacterized protein n=1 Tax=Krasilnikovia cinnamomea TaxID=349313 RepID=A0A4V2G6G1_9ACTN|nr:hypothetical protein EV385_0293 [Krasilnikovia cinnamomea]